MNICLYYILSNEVAQRWNRTVSLQRSVLPEWGGIPKVFITDVNYPYPVPGERVTANLFSDGIIQFPKAKNLGLGWAQNRGHDWVIDVDADTVILKMPTRVPSTGYSTVLCHNSSPKDTDDDLVKRYETGKMSFGASSRFILRKDIFTKYRYDEGYVDWTWDDIDYHVHSLKANGILYEHSGALGIHLWHSRFHEKRGNGYERFQMKKGARP